MEVIPAYLSECMAPRVPRMSLQEENKAYLNYIHVVIFLIVNPNYIQQRKGGNHLFGEPQQIYS